MFSVILLICAVITTTTMASENSVKVLKANADFTTNLYQVLSRKEGNLIFSPISAHTVLSLAYQGAAGSTAESFANTLKLPNAALAKDGYKNVIEALNNVQNVTLHVANKIYAKTGYKLKPTFNEVARNSFYSEVEQVNFDDRANAAKTINSWVEQKTQDKIKDLISPDSLDTLTRLVLVNAIYFKGNWADKFDKSKTKKQPFYLNDSEKIDVDMMHITKKFRYGESSDLDAKLLELPYENRELSLLIILPNQRNGIQGLESKLSSVDITSLTSGMYSAEVNVALPKFKIESKIDLKDALKEVRKSYILYFLDIYTSCFKLEDFSRKIIYVEQTEKKKLA